jgi:hypothetical protein
VKLVGKVKTAIGYRDVTAEAPTYDQAMSDLKAQVEDGEYLVAHPRQE